MSYKLLCKGSNKDNFNLYIPSNIQSLEPCIVDAIVRRTRVKVSLDYGVQYYL